MQTYREYSPTPFDPKGLNLPDQQDWLVVIGRNRDSDVLAESNFDTALDMLGGESDDCEIHRFGHWACGWLEIIIVRPGSEAANIAVEIEESLSDYPVLNESDWSKREYESYIESWESWGLREFRSGLVDNLALSEEEEEQLDGISSDQLLEFFESLIPSGEYRYDDCSPRIDAALKDCTREDYDSFLESLT